MKEHIYETETNSHFKTNVMGKLVGGGKELGKCD